MSASVLSALPEDKVDKDSLRYVVEVVLRVVAHPLRRAELDGAVDDARIRAHVPESLVPRVRAQHPIPDSAELRESDVQLRAHAPAAGRVDAAMEVVQPRVDRLDECIARGCMSA